MKINIMVWFVCAISLYLISFWVFADEHNINFSLKEQANKTSQTILHPQKNRPQIRQIKHNPGSWSEGFKPSEKIDADSVISFPVDI